MNTQVLKMPYKDESELISMFIFLPDNSPSAIDVFLDKLSPEILDDVFNPNIDGHFYKYDVFVSHPKFSLKRSYDLSSVC